MQKYSIFASLLSQQCNTLYLILYIVSEVQFYIFLIENLVAFITYASKIAQFNFQYFVLLCFGISFPIENEYVRIFIFSSNLSSASAASFLSLSHSVLSCIETKNCEKWIMQPKRCINNSLCSFSHSGPVSIDRKLMKRNKTARANL